MGAFIAVIILLALAFVFVGFRASKNNSAVIDRLSDQLQLGKQTSSISALEELQYLGGHPMLPNSGKAMISFREHGFVVVAGGKAAASKYSIIKFVDVMNQDQISRDVTMTRLLTLGVFAFAAKKKRVTHSTFIKMVIELKGIESTVLFQAKSAQLASVLNAGRLQNA